MIFSDPAMPIDRSRFLFLTASLAAAACNQPQPAASPDTGGADPARSSDAKPSTRSSESDPASKPGAPSVWLEIEPGTEDRQVTPGDPTCDNSVGKPSSCSLTAPPGHCESFDSTQNLCRSFAEVMQPRGAEAAVDCMLAASGTHKICEWELWNQCTTAGLQASCVEPATRSECESISSSCGGTIDVFTCQQALSSVQPRHLGSLSSCVREFCQIEFCVTQLAPF